MPRLDPLLPHDIFARPKRPFARGVASGERRRAKPIEGLLAPGAILDKYRIDALLGTGGFGAVYRATHLILRTTVAIKHLRADVLARRPDVASQLLDEARWAARIQHPSVVRVFDVTQGPALTYVVMEFIDGETLAQAIDARGRLAAREVAQVGIDVAEGLLAALVQGLVHRDVKPANILLGKDGRARIVDLGLARAVAVSSQTPSARGSVVGTRGYVAPEQLVDPARVDFRADVYSLGVTLAEALRGRGTNAVRAIPVDGCSRALARVLHRMTAPDADDRPRSYAELVDSLHAAKEPR